MKQKSKAIAVRTPTIYKRERERSQGTSLKKKVNPTGRIDLLAGSIFSRLIDGVGKDLGLPSLHDELHPIVQQNLRGLKNVRIPDEIMGIGRAVLRDKFG